IRLRCAFGDRCPTAQSRTRRGCGRRLFGRTRVPGGLSSQMSQTFRSLSEPNYRHWFAGALISNTGTWMQRTAQDWIVLTMLTDNNASALGFTMALQLGPQLIMFPFAGNLVDKFDKRRLLMVTQSLLGSIGLILFALVITDVIVLWHVYVLAFTLGMLTTLDNPARQAFVSELVGEKLLPNAVSLNSASFNGARMIGPAVAGVLTALIGAGPVFLISGLGFAATLTVLIRLDRFRAPPSRPRGRGRPPDPGQPQPRPLHRPPMDRPRGGRGPHRSHRRGPGLLLHRPGIRGDAHGPHPPRQVPAASVRTQGPGRCARRSEVPAPA